MPGNFVFDIDGTIAIVADYQAEEVEKSVKAKFGDEFFNEHCLTAYGYPHYIFPGYYALFKWLHSIGGKIFFFSSGIEERNVELADKIMKKSFGEAVSEVEYRVFSRQHCVDTNDLPFNEAREKYQSYFWGKRKKKLSGIVVPETELPNTLLIDDDYSYMIKGEEYNFVYVRYTHMYLQSFNTGAYNETDGFSKFHKAYYLAGLFSKMFEVREDKKISLVEAAKYVQIDMEGKELNKDFFYPGTGRIEYFITGKEILQRFDPALEFYYSIPGHSSGTKKQGA